MRNKKISLIIIICFVFSLFIISGCGKPSSVEEESNNQETQQQEAIKAVPPPAISNFNQRKTMKMIQEDLDKEKLTTYTYIASMQGNLVFVGESIGYPISAGFQFNNPEQIVHYNGGAVSVPQAEPNGLYSPSSDEGTYVMMIDKSTGKARPVYFETRIVCSPFRLDK